mgnify:CR=1 FL=1
MDKIKKLFQSNDSKRGSYTLAMTSIVIAIVIIFNMIVNLIPENKRQFDISSTNIYEISSKSEKIIKKVDDDVTFYVLAEKDSTDKRIKTFINKYASLSSKLHVKWIDPILHPSALTKYGKPGMIKEIISGNRPDEKREVLQLGRRTIVVFAALFALSCFQLLFCGQRFGDDRRQ